MHWESAWCCMHNQVCATPHFPICLNWLCTTLQHYRHDACSLRILRLSIHWIYNPLHFKMAAKFCYVGFALSQKLLHSDEISVSVWPYSPFSLSFTQATVYLLEFVDLPLFEAALISQRGLLVKLNKRVTSSHISLNTTSLSDSNIWFLWGSKSRWDLRKNTMKRHGVSSKPLKMTGNRYISL